jgi:hypothetical protein
MRYGWRLRTCRKLLLILNDIDGLYRHISYLENNSFETSTRSSYEVCWYRRHDLRRLVRTY